MKKRDLEMYSSLKKRAKKLKEDISELKTKDVESVSAKVKGSMKEFPYTERRFSVEMEVPEKSQKIKDSIVKKEAELREIEKRLTDIESFIDNIEDIHIKTIFEYKYLEGLTQAEVGKKVGLDRSRISRKIDKYIKTHTKHKKSVL